MSISLRFSRTHYPYTKVDPNYFSTENTYREGLDSYFEFNLSGPAKKDKELESDKTNGNPEGDLVKRSPKQLPPRKDLRRSLVKEEDGDLVLSSLENRGITMNLIEWKSGLNNLKNAVIKLGTQLESTELPIDMDQVNTLVAQIESSIDYALSLDNDNIPEHKVASSASVKAKIAKTLLNQVNLDLTQLSRVVANSLVTVNKDAVGMAIRDFNALKKELDIYRSAF